MPKSFKYLGYTFTPHRNFNSSEDALGHLNLPFHGIGISNYDNPRQTYRSSEWNYDEFYRIATKKKLISDIYLLNKKAVVIPCQNELFAYGKDEAKKVTP